MKLNAKQLRITKPTEEQLANIKRKPIYIVLDNVLDTYNIGSIFRLADGIAASEVILCGGCETPPASRLHRAAIGTEEWVPWRYFAKTTDAIIKLREEVPGIKIVAVEQDEKAIPLKQLFSHNSPPTPLHNNAPSHPPLNLREGNLSDLVPVAVVVGHETDGVAREVMDMSDVIVEIPMWGVNKSLNVHVSASIVLYKILDQMA